MEWFNKEKAVINVKRRAMIILAFAEIYGKSSVHVGRANRPHEVWVSSPKAKSCNLFAAFTQKVKQQKPTTRRGVAGTSSCWLPLLMVTRVFGSPTWSAFRRGPSR